MVFKVDAVFPVGIQRHQLAGGVHEPGGGDGFFRDLVHTRQQVFQRSLAAGIGFDFVYAVAVRRFHQEHRIGDRVAGVGVLFIDNEVGPLLVLNGDGAGLAGKQLHMVLAHINNVVGHRGGLLHRVHTRFQIGDVDFAVGIGDAVKIVGAILNLGNPKMHTTQPGTVRAGLDEPEGGLGGVGKHKGRIFIGVDLYHTDGIVNEVPIRRFQLPDFVCAGG